MPRLSCWFIRAALLYLAAGFTLGAVLLAGKGLAFPPVIWRLLPVHIEFLLVGWTVQLVMGVAFSILPRFLQGGRRREGAAWLAFVLLNAGVLLATVGPLLEAPSAVLLAGRALEAAAAVAYMVHAWPRVKPMGA